MVVFSGPIFRFIWFIVDSIPKSSYTQFLILDNDPFKNYIVGSMEFRNGKRDCILPMFDQSVELGNRGQHHHIDAKVDYIKRKHIDVVQVVEEDIGILS